MDSYLKPTEVTIAELINLVYIKPCCGCGRNIALIPYALLCERGHIWFNCPDCHSTNLIANKSITKS